MKATFLQLLNDVCTSKSDKVWTDTNDYDLPSDFDAATNKWDFKGLLLKMVQHY